MCVQHIWTDGKTGMSRLNGWITHVGRPDGWAVNSCRHQKMFSMLKVACCSENFVHYIPPSRGLISDSAPPVDPAEGLHLPRQVYPAVPLMLFGIFSAALRSNVSRFHHGFRLLMAVLRFALQTPTQLLSRATNPINYAPVPTFHHENQGTLNGSAQKFMYRLLTYSMIKIFAIVTVAGVEVMP